MLVNWTFMLKPITPMALLMPIRSLTYTARLGEGSQVAIGGSWDNTTAEPATNKLQKDVFRYQDMSRSTMGNKA